MRYFLIAGERSGDLHGSFLIDELLKLDPDAKIYCWGGDYMRRAGGELLRHYKDTAVMGFWEVLKNLRRLSKLQQVCKQQISEVNPDALIFIDFPGFNLRIAEWSKTKGFKNFYYISPKVWAWNQKRALKIKKVVDELYCILPFEPQFFLKYQFRTTYVGNPLKQTIDRYSFDHEFIERYQKASVVAVLPGSREQEVSKVVELLGGIVPRRKDVFFLVAGVDNVARSAYEPLHSLGENVELVFDKTYEILKVARAAIVTSGTATLEAALLNAPQVVVYRTSNLSYQLAKRLIKVPFISLVNLIADQEVVRELIQSDMNPQTVLEEVDRLMNDTASRNKMFEGYKTVADLLGNQNAPLIVAMNIIAHLQNTRS